LYSFLQLSINTLASSRAVKISHSLNYLWKFKNEETIYFLIKWSSAQPIVEDVWVRERGLGQKKTPPAYADGVSIKNPASSYSPTQLPVQYHRR
jgi:hypothetical protein